MEKYDFGASKEEKRREKKEKARKNPIYHVNVMDIEEVAKTFRCNSKQIRELIQEDAFSAFKTNKGWLIPVSSIDAFIERRVKETHEEILGKIEAKRKNKLQKGETECQQVSKAQSAL